MSGCATLGPRDRSRCRGSSRGRDTNPAMARRHRPTTYLSGLPTALVIRAGHVLRQHHHVRGAAVPDQGADRLPCARGTVECRRAGAARGLRTVGRSAGRRDRPSADRDRVRGRDAAARGTADRQRPASRTARLAAVRDRGTVRDGRRAATALVGCDARQGRPPRPDGCRKCVVQHPLRVRFHPRRHWPG